MKRTVTAAAAGNFRRKVDTASRLGGICAFCYFFFFFLTVVVSRLFPLFLRTIVVPETGMCDSAGVSPAANLFLSEDMSEDVAGEVFDSTGMWDLLDFVRIPWWSLKTWGFRGVSL